jgi:hypothetical protein
LETLSFENPTPGENFHSHKFAKFADLPFGFRASGFVRISASWLFTDRASRRNRDHCHPRRAASSGAFETQTKGAVNDVRE